MTVGTSPLSAGAATPPLHLPVGGFATSNGTGFWMVYADGLVFGSSKADEYGGPYGSPWGLSLNAPIVGGAMRPGGRGYWVAGADGGVFAFGHARYYGSMGAAHLNQPVVSLAPTKSGKGYWLVASDGGVFSFGDARFYGSTGNLILRQPIVGMTTSASGRGYRLVARDGGIFDFGDAHFVGSLPGRGVQVSDVVGMATTPSHAGYWIAGADGQVYAFGDAHSFGRFNASACDPVTAIFSNPHGQGYRLVTESGATISFGNAPGGGQASGIAFSCPPVDQPPLEGGVLAVGGQIGPLQLGVSTEADLAADIGTPEATAVGNIDVGLPNYIALGYDCSVIPGAIPLVVEPQVLGPYCGTVYYLNVKTQTLAGFQTVSSRYETAEGTTVGMTSIEAAQREGQQPSGQASCLPDSIRLGNMGGYVGTATPAQIEIWIGSEPTETVTDITVENSANPVGLLSC